MSFQRFAGIEGSVALARAWTRRVLLGEKVNDEAVAQAELIVSEFATNAIRHSRSGQLGGSFVVDLDVYPTWARICVVDQGTDDMRLPTWGTNPNPLANSGYGLLIVATIATKHMTIADDDRCMVIADIPTHTHTTTTHKPVPRGL